MNLIPILCEDDENIFVFDRNIEIEISQVALKIGHDKLLYTSLYVINYL
jgi:hypothetical protein